MLGFILALFYAAAIIIFRDTAPEVAYLHSTNFLFWWYVIWTIILGAFIGLFALITTLGGAAAGALEGRGIGALLGAAVGGVFSGVIVLIFAARRAMYIGGAYLLSTALTPAPPWEWRMPHLIIGGMLLLIAFITGAEARASSSHSH